MFNQIRYQKLDDDHRQRLQNNHKLPLSDLLSPSSTNSTNSTSSIISSTTNNNNNINDNHETMLDLTYYQELMLNKQFQNPELSSLAQKQSNLEFSALDFYHDKTILVTGATGFIGKILVEKLLRIGIVRRVYVLLRAKYGKKPEDRLRELLERSRAFHFHQLDLDKIHPISGDITEPNLGLSEEDRKLLQDEVDIVFHSAASVQFKGALKMFLEQNVLGTDRIMKLCTEMVRLKAVVYVSTAYANCNLTYIEEKVYPLSLNESDKDVVTINACQLDDFIQKTIRRYGNEQPKAGHRALCGRLNCYTFSKALAETLVWTKYGQGQPYRLPVVICRPSIVTHSMDEPTKGWCDTKNGVSGAMILGGLGVARTMIVNTDCKADCIPVDYVVNSMIVMGAHTAISPPDQRKQVFHITTGEWNPITWGQLLEYSRMAICTKPFMKQIRPLAKKPVATDNFYGRLSHQFTKIFSHYCFALVADGLIMMCGYGPFMMDITNRMHQGFDTLQPFTSREWRFQFGNYHDVYQMLPPKERDIFRSDIRTINWLSYIDDATLGTRRYMMKDDDSTIQRALKRQKRLTWAYRGVEVLAYLGILGTIYWQIF